LIAMAMEMAYLERYDSQIFSCDHPRTRMIQYAAAFMLDRGLRGILDRPVEPGDDMCWMDRPS